MKIAPCSFCGSKAVRPQKASIGMDWSVVCEGCDAIGPSELSAKFAVQAWNRVAPPAWAVRETAYQELNEQQAQVIHDLRIENSGQAAVIERLQDRIRKLEFALERIRDIDWLQYSNRIDAIQQFAKEALE